MKNAIDNVGGAITDAIDSRITSLAIYLTKLSQSNKNMAGIEIRKQLQAINDIEEREKLEHRDMSEMKNGYQKAIVFHFSETKKSTIMVLTSAINFLEKIETNNEVLTQSQERIRAIQTLKNLRTETEIETIRQYVTMYGNRMYLHLSSRNEYTS